MCLSLLQPCPGGLTKNDHFRNMLTIAREREFSSELVAFDSWCSSLENLKLVRNHIGLAIHSYLLNPTYILSSTAYLLIVYHPHQAIICFF